ncbi:efflux transporter outer membrane subunit [Magnetospirillum sp. XM-1]|uniref:efflux transporter outer membrane subunit n=1 Tax=Magnetospirillum sp. XM-1 TaxID=1663591 RepID=UPI001560CC64|nr:efflux transporter outer membrane subunit [Magnetospirillum sp. XM-1]
MVVALTVSSTACNVTPNYERPKQDIPASYRNPLPEPSPEMPKPLSQWWKIFGSEELDKLVEEALANNHDLKAAAARIRQADATAGSAASSLLPTISASGKRSVDSPQGGQGADPNPPTNRTHRLSSAYVSASWEVDLWGKIRASEASALATAFANVHDREAVGLSMISDVVLSYIQYLEGMDRETVARSNIANMKAMYQAVSERVRLGESSNLELAQQRNVLAQAEATIPPIVLQRERAFNKLAVLLGRPPQTLSLNGRTLRDLRVPEVSAGLPSDLLLRRPDIRKAEANLVAANANIGVARAKLFPTLSISGDRGWAAQYFDNITNPTSIFFTLAGTMAATLFDNGKTRSDIEYSEGKYVELIETYQQTVLVSLRDVEDALMAVRLQGDLEVAQQEVLQASLDAYGLSSEAFRLGMVDYLNVLETQRTRFQAEDSKVQARFGRLEAAIGLYKALGGGMELDEDAEEPNTPPSAPAGQSETRAAPPSPAPATAPTPPAAPAATEAPPPPATPLPPVETEQNPTAPSAINTPAARLAPPPPATPAAQPVETAASTGNVPASFQSSMDTPIPSMAPADIYETAAFNDNAS